MAIPWDEYVQETLAAEMQLRDIQIKKIDFESEVSDGLTSRS